MDVTKYETLLFDCDGVILNSNKVKTDAFYQAAIPYGQDAAQELVSYHVANGGISRYEKFAYFLENLVSDSRSGPDLNDLLDSYSEKVFEGLMSCDITKRLDELREKTSNSKWLIVSGGDQQELRKIFKLREIHSYFDGGIFGSPDTKDEILAREVANKNINGHSLFIGDSKYDYLASTTAGFDFIFISGWSEFEDFNNYFASKNIECLDYVSDLLL